MALALTETVLAVVSLSGTHGLFPLASGQAQVGRRGVA